MKKRTAILAALIALSAINAEAWFGFGKKKESKPAEPSGPTQPPREDQADEPPQSAASERPSAIPPAEDREEEPRAETDDAVKREPAPAAAPTSLPTEVVIKAEEGAGKLSSAKPPLAIDIDPFESIRPSLKPDEGLLLAVSPLTVSWRRTHPEFLASSRVIQPWRMTFSPRPGIVFRPREQLHDTLQRRLDPKEAKSYAWTLTIADEEGRVFHRYEGPDDPPEELLWSGQNDQGEWIHAGRAYSAVYTFTDPGGSPRTSVAKPLLFRGIVHQEDSGLHISLDSAVLFGSSKTSAQLQETAGKDVLRSAADLIKRRYSGIPISVRVFASTKELGESQGQSINQYLLRELMVAPQNINVSATRASYSEQRVELVLLNR